MLAFGSRQKNFLEFLLQLYSSLAQSVEHSAVNRVVVGSSPTGGAIWPVGQAVKTPPFHGGNESSILSRVTKNPSYESVRDFLFFLFPYRKICANIALLWYPKPFFALA